MNSRKRVILNTQRVGIHRPKPSFIPTAARGIWALTRGMLSWDLSPDESHDNIPLPDGGLEIQMKRSQSPDNPMLAKGNRGASAYNWPEGVGPHPCHPDLPILEVKLLGR